MYKSFFKRILDMGFSAMGIIILGPIIVLMIISLSIYYQGPPFFIQNRPGKFGRIFKVIKFRTMTNKKDLSTSDNP